MSQDTRQRAHREFLRHFYNSQPDAVGRTAFLRQVAHTESGQPINDEQFQLMVESIVDQLDLTADDHLLDLCCGNGYLTSQLAPHVTNVTGVDFSAALIDVATQFNQPDNCKYLQCDVTQLAALKSEGLSKCNKVLMFAALQHFQHEELVPLLAAILKVTNPNVSILIGFIPNKDMRLRFYDSVPRKLAWIVRSAIGKDVIGTWWTPEFISNACVQLGLECHTQAITYGLRASKYRFDAVISRIQQI